MVPLPNHSTVGGVPLKTLLPADKLNAIVERTKKGGGELVNLMGTSAWYAPGAAAVLMAESIVRDQKRVFPCCVLLKGEYGLKDVYLGVPVSLGKKGVERIIEMKLDEEETKNLNDSCSAVKTVMNVLDDMKLF
jgi:malate dehydrogenase